MTWFIGRQEELQALETAYQKDSFQLGILYGRRRIGKTTLLRQFCTGERAVFFTARNTTTERNVELFGQCAAKTLGGDKGTASFQSFEELCDFLGTQSQNERIVVVIDEFPYLAGKDKSILPTLQKYIDEQWQSGKMFLILCGSSDGFMEKEVLGPKSLLSGRSTMQMKLEAFDYRQSALFLPSWSAYDQAVAYGLTGGVAQYISLFDENKSLEENIVSLFFSKSGCLYEEAENHLSRVFRDEERISRILEILASGANQVREIAEKSGLPTRIVSRFLKTLMEAGMVERQQAMTEENNKKKSRYVLADDMLRFWFRFIPEAMEAIESDEGRLYYQNNVRPKLASFMESVFEKMCRQYTLGLGILGVFPCKVACVGTWWGTNPGTREPMEIDVAGLDRTRREAVAGVCRFRRGPIDRKAFDSVQAWQNARRGKVQVEQVLFFSVSEFPDWLIEEARNGNIRLIRLEEMY